MLFEDTTLLLLWVACTYFFVQLTLGLHGYFKSSADKLQEQLIKRLDEIVHRVKVEQHEDVYYWYDQDNNRFLGQGKTTEEIINVLKARFPEHIFYFDTNNTIICAKHNWVPQSTIKS